MIDVELAARLTELETKLDATRAAAEAARKYLLWSGIVGAILFILPLIGLAFAIPTFLSVYTTGLSGVGF